MATILLLEDDKTIASGLSYALTQESYEVITAATITEALQLLTQCQIDLALLDIGLPDGSGFDVCAELRRRGSTPVIFLTARDDEVTTVMALDMGADDYVSKPFRLRELLSRVKSVLRRTNLSAPPILESGVLSVYPHLAKVYKQGREIELTALEYRLLLIFLQHRGQTLERGQLLRDIWDVAGAFVDDNTLSVYIRRLRDKIEDDPKNPQLLLTVRGIGYRWAG